MDKTESLLIGITTVVIGVPARHIHSHSNIIHRDDYDNALKLVVALVQKLDTEVVQSLTEQVTPNGGTP